MFKVLTPIPKAPIVPKAFGIGVGTFGAKLIVHSSMFEV
jgi:hypothetical protein